MSVGAEDITAQLEMHMAFGHRSGPSSQLGACLVAGHLGDNHAFLCVCGHA